MDSKEATTPYSTVNSSGDNGKDDVKVTGSDDEGYVSGEEEFEVGLVGTVGEENSDVLFVDAPEKVESLPISDEHDDDDVEKGTNSENLKGSGGEIVVEKEGDDVVEENGAVGSLTVVDEPEVKEDVAGVDVAELKESEVVDSGDVESGLEGDVVVDTIQVDVAGPGVVVVGASEENGGLEDKLETKDVEVEKPVTKDVVEVEKSVTKDVGLENPEIKDVVELETPETKDVVELETPETKDVVEPEKPETKDVVELETPELKDVVEPEKQETKDVVETEKQETKDVVETDKPEVVATDDASLTAEGDSSSVGTNQADSGTVVIDEPKENGESAIEPEKNSLAEVADVESEVAGPAGVKITTEGDTIVDTIQVDPVVPGIAVVGETEGNSKDVDSTVETVTVDSVVPGVALAGENEESGKALVEETEESGKDAVELDKSEVLEPEDVKLTSEGDAIVDTISIQVKPVAPGVVAVGDLEENGGEKVEGVEVPREYFGGVNGNSDGVEEVADNNQSSEPPVELKSLQPNNHGAEAAVDLVNGVHTPIASNESVDRDGTLDMDNNVKKPDQEQASVVYEAKENGIVEKFDTDGEVEDEMDDEVDPEDSMSDEETDGMVFGSSDAAKKFMEELEQGSGAGSSLDQSQRIDGQIVTDSEEEEEGDSDDEGEGKELFDSAALAALLKAATGAESDGGSITITSQDGSRLFSVERPAGLGPSLQSLRPAPQRNRPLLFNPSNITSRGEPEENLSEDEKKKLEKLQQIRVKFLRLVHRLGLSTEESVAAQVLYRLALLGGRQGTQTFSLDAAKQTALQLEAEDGNDLDFSLNILVLGKSGVGKSSTINAIFGEEKASIDAFERGTATAKELRGSVNGVQVKVIDTPGLKSSIMEQSFNRSILSSVQKLTKKSPPDVVLYVDRLDAQTRDLNDLPLLKTITASLGPATWRSAIVTLTHAASAPPDGPSGAPLSYEVFVTQRSHVVQQSIGHAVGDLRMMSPSLMNPVSLVENHRDCRTNREGNKILPNGSSWRPQLLLLCYSMKILSEASALSKPQDPLDHRKLFGFRVRSPPLPYMLSSMLQSRPYPKLPSDQNGESVDSDIDLDEFSDSDQEEEDEYDQLPPFKPLRKAQLAKLSREQTKAYFEEYDYRVKLLQKKQWKEELRRMKEMKKRGKDSVTDYNFAEEEADMGAAAPVAVPLPDMALPPSFDGDSPAYRYRFLEPTSQFLARPVLDSHGWDHDCGYDGVNLEHSLAILNRFGASYTVQITKDKKDFSISLDSSVATKVGENMSTMAGFDIQSMGKQLAYIVRAETKSKNLKKHKAAGGISLTFLGENVVPGVKIEDQIKLGKQFVLVGSAGAVKSQQETAYGANFELQRRELDYPIGQIQSNISMSIIKWRGDLALGLNSLAQFSIGRNSKVAVRAGINNKLSGQVTVRTSSSDHLSLALTAVVPTVLSIYKKLWPGTSDRFY